MFPFLVRESFFSSAKHFCLVAVIQPCRNVKLKHRLFHYQGVLLLRLHGRDLHVNPAAEILTCKKVQHSNEASFLQAKSHLIIKCKIDFHSPSETHYVYGYIKISHKAMWVFVYFCQCLYISAEYICHGRTKLLSVTAPNCMVFLNS